MTLVKKVGWLSRHYPNLASLKDYIGNLEEFKYGQLSSWFTWVSHLISFGKENFILHVRCCIKWEWSYPR